MLFRSIAVTTEAAQGTSYAKLVDYQDQIAQVINQDPNVTGLVSTIGGSAANTLGGPNLGQIVVHLKPRGDRRELANDIIAKLRAAEATPAKYLFFINPPLPRTPESYASQAPQDESSISGVAALV